MAGSSGVIKISDEAHFQTELGSAGPKLVVVDFTASWCGPCKRVAPFFEEFSNKYQRAVFLKVDVDECQETAAANKITAMPTFVFFRNKTKIDQMSGADTNALEEKIKQHIGEDGGEEEDAGVKGYMDIGTFLDKKACECLNEDDDHPYTHCLKSGGGFLQSDCDEQLIMSLSYNQQVKLHSIKIKAPKDKGPKTIRIFINQPRTLDFDGADSMVSTQDLSITADQLDGGIIPLKFVKFQNVTNVQFFIKDNQGGGDVTQVDHLAIIGTPISTTNMNEFKRVAGKKGESDG
jgi:thioredoxin